MTEFVGVLPREIAIVKCKVELGAWARELLEITNDGQNDILSVSAWDAVRLLAAQIDPEKLLAELHLQEDARDRRT